MDEAIRYSQSQGKDIFTSFGAKESDSMSLCQSNKKNTEEETEKKKKKENPSLRVNAKVPFPKSIEHSVFSGKRNIQVV